MEKPELVRIMGPSRYIKKHEGKWRYFPFSVNIEEYYFNIKDGKKNELKNELWKDFKYVLIISPIIFGLAAVYKYTLLISFIFPLLMVHRKRKYIKNLTIESNLDKPKYFKTKYKEIYLIINENDNITYGKMLIGTLISLFAIFFYVGNKSFVGIAFSIFGFLLFSTVFGITTIKKMNT